MTALWRRHCGDASGSLGWHALRIRTAAHFGTNHALSERATPRASFFRLFAFGMRLGLRLRNRRECFGQPRHMFRADWHGDGRPFEVVADRFESAAKLLGQKCLRYGIKRLIILWPMKAMSFVRIKHVR